MGEIPAGLHNSAAGITGPPAGDQLAMGRKEGEVRKRGGEGVCTAASFIEKTLLETHSLRVCVFI